VRILKAIIAGDADDRGVRAVDVGAQEVCEVVE